MAYVTSKAEIKGRIPAAFFDEAIVDEGEDKWTQIVADADSAVDAIIGLRFTVPRINPEPVVTEAAKVHVCYSLYNRRGVSDDANPWASRFDTWFGDKGLLMKIATGAAPLGPEAARTQPSASVIKENARTYDTAGRRIT